MTTAPFEPDPHIGEQQIAAADAGRGAPQPAPGFGLQGEEPDVIEPPEDSEDFPGDPADDAQQTE